MPSVVDKQAFLAVQDLSVRFRHADQFTLQSLNFVIQSGERVAIVGASGCGKTTLLHALLGIVPDLIPAHLSGSVIWGNADRSPSLHNAAWSHASFLSQASGPQIATLAVADEIAFPLQSRGIDGPAIDQRIATALSSPLLRGLDETASTLTLSGGWRQRLALSAVHAPQTDCIVLDEPLLHLDESGRDATLGVLHDGLTPQQTLIIVDHRLALIPSVADRAIVLGGDGTLLADGTASIILADQALLREAGLHRAWSRHSHVEEPGEPLLTVTDATLRRDREILLEDINLVLRSGEILGISGSNGAGKTSLALALAGGLRFRGGCVARHDNARVLLVPQNPDLFFATGSLGDEAQRFRLPWAVFSANAQKLGMMVTPRDHPFHFSQGQKRRLALALALPADKAQKRVLILDEPQAGLDGVALADVSEAISALASNGHAIMIIAHDRDWLASIADRRMTIKDRRLQDLEFLL
jgi:energy-coupling factor transport system ATP-binding protein